MRRSLWIFQALLVLAPVTSADEITACVEPSIEIANNLRAKRASTRSDCSPEIAFQKAQNQSRKNARDAIAKECKRRVSMAEARAWCISVGMAMPNGATAMGQSPIALQGRSSIDDAKIIQSNGLPKLCAALRDIPQETEKWETSAGIENGGCIFNNARLTHIRVRSRAYCAIQCQGTFRQ